jgi:lipopolysaccharide export system permease protein
MEVGVLGTILHRAILWELARVFALSLLGITGILVFGGVMAEASRQGLNPLQTLAAIPLLIPSTLPFTIPATTLFATCVVYGRLTHDNEVTALKAAGVNILRIVAPGIFLGLMMSLVTLGLYYRIIPYSTYLLRARALSDVEEYLYTLLKRDHCFVERRLNYAIWVRQVQGTHLQQVLVKRRDEKDKGYYDAYIYARDAELHVDLKRLKIVVTMHHGEILSERGDRLRFVKEDWEVPLPPDLIGDLKIRPQTLSWQQILQRRRDIEAKEEEKTAEIALQALQESLTSRPDLPKHIANLMAEKHKLELEMYALNTELNLRPALCFGCLCFVLVGCPVGIWFGRSDYLSAFVTSFLPTVFTYYPLYLCGANLAKQGRIPAPLGVWAANAFMALVALALFRRLMRN